MNKNSTRISKSYNIASNCLGKSLNLRNSHRAGSKMQSITIMNADGKKNKFQEFYSRIKFTADSYLNSIQKVLYPLSYYSLGV